MSMSLRFARVDMRLRAVIEDAIGLATILAFEIDAAILCIFVGQIGRISWNRIG